MGFRKWFERNLGDSAWDISRYGCDAGFPHITYTSDCVKIYDRFEAEIYEALNQDAQAFGFDSVDAFTASFRRKDMLSDPDSRKALLVWYMCEKLAHEVGG